MGIRFYALVKSAPGTKTPEEKKKKLINKINRNLRKIGKALFYNILTLYDPLLAEMVHSREAFPPIKYENKNYVIKPFSFGFLPIKNNYNTPSWLFIISLPENIDITHAIYEALLNSIGKPIKNLYIENITTAKTTPSPSFLVTSPMLVRIPKNLNNNTTPHWGKFISPLTKNSKEWKKFYASVKRSIILKHLFLTGKKESKFDIFFIEGCLKRLSLEEAKNKKPITISFQGRIHIQGEKKILDTIHTLGIGTLTPSGYGFVISQEEKKWLTQNGFHILFNI